MATDLVFGGCTGLYFHVFRSSVCYVVLVGNNKGWLWCVRK